MNDIVDENIISLSLFLPGTMNKGFIYLRIRPLTAFLRACSYSAWVRCQRWHHEGTGRNMSPVFSRFNTVNPRINPRGLICKNKFFGGGLFEGCLFEGGLFQSLAFSSKVDIKNDIILSIN